MNPFPSIVCGVDYSESSAAALAEAYRIAAALDSHLTVAHILPDDHLAAAQKWSGLERGAILSRRRLRLDRFCLETLETTSLPSLKLELIVGYPFIEIIRLCEREEANLLVLGTHGESHPRPSTTGSLAVRCVRMAPTEVLLVREAQHGGFKRIVAAVDFSEGSHRAMRQAAALAKADGAELHMLHIFAPAWKSSAIEFGETHVSDEGVQRYLEDVNRRAAEFVCEGLDDFEGLPATIVVREHFSVGGGMVNYLNEVGADLVVLGARAHNRPEIMALGSTAEFIIHDAPCSVLTVQPEGEIFHP